MTGQELRIGNILDYAGQSVLVLGIHQAETLGKSHYLDLWYYGDSIVFERHENDEDLKPITLTPEWLEKFGFKSDLEDWYYITTVKDQYLASNPHGVYLSNTDPEDESKHADEFSVKLDIRYVHQLQNLYWCLCGKELELKQ